jgi:serine protease Do
MNLKFTALISTSVTALLALPALALEAPEDNSPPPKAALRQANLPEIKLPQTQMNKPPTAFIGVVTGDIPAVLSEHLGLAANEGIIVHSLVPEGPAAKAGLAVSDVITKVGGKSISTPAELRQEIAERRVGEKVSVEFIHKGAVTHQDVVLTSRPLGLAQSSEPQVFDSMNLQGLPEDIAERIRSVIAGNTGPLEIQLGKLKDVSSDPLHGAVKDLFDRQGAQNPPKADAEGKIQLHSGSTVKMQDDQGCVEVTAKDGDKQVTLRDPQNQVTWSGPWNCDKDKAAAPEAVRQRIGLLNLDTQSEGPGMCFKLKQ